MGATYNWHRCLFVMLPSIFWAFPYFVGTSWPRLPIDFFFLRIPGIHHSSKELWYLLVWDGIRKPNLGGRFAHCYWCVSICPFRANINDGGREHCCHLAFIWSLCWSLPPTDVVGMGPVWFYFCSFDLILVGRMCGVVCMQETTEIWALTGTSEIQGLLVFPISRALSVSRVIKI